MFYKVSISVSFDDTIRRKMNLSNFIEIERLSVDRTTYYAIFFITYEGEMNQDRKKINLYIGKKFRQETNSKKKPKILKIEPISYDEYKKCEDKNKEIKLPEGFGNINQLIERSREWENKYKEMEICCQREWKEKLKLSSELKQILILNKKLNDELEEERNKQCDRFHFIKGDVQEEENSSKVCKICLTNKETHCLIPCGHIFCGDCGEYLHNNKQHEKCPLCKNTYLHVQRIFIL